MKFFESIKSFFKNLTVKKLPSGNIVETDVIPIRYSGKLDKRLAELIRDEIKRYNEFYSVFLEEYDEIHIGDIAEDTENVLRVDNEIQKSTWKYAR